MNLDQQMEEIKSSYNFIIDTLVDRQVGTRLSYFLFRSSKIVMQYISFPTKLETFSKNYKEQGH